MRGITLAVLALLVALSAAKEDGVDRKGDVKLKNGDGADTKRREQKEFDGRQAAFKRKLTVNVRKDDVDIKSSRRDEDSKESLRFRLRLVGAAGLRIGMQSSKQTEVDGKKQTARERLRLACNTVLVVNGLADSTVGFQKGVDTVVSTTELGNVTWQDFSCSDQKETDEDGNDVATKRCIARTQDGFLTVTAEVAGAIFLKKASKVYPTALKFAIALDGQLPANHYYVLRCRMTTRAKGEKKADDQNRHKRVSFGGESSASFFSWEPEAVDENAETLGVIASAIVDEGVEEVRDEDTNELEDEYRRRVDFTFNASGVRRVDWDPQLGAGEAFASTSSTSAAATTGQWAAALSAVMAGFALLW